MTWNRVVLLALGCAMATSSVGRAVAAPLCIEVTGIPPQCLYYDPADCRREAARQGGVCAANAAELRAPIASGEQYCVVESGNAVSCLYPDRGSCEAEGRRRNGACIQAPPPPEPPPTLDPYKIVRPY